MGGDQGQSKQNQITDKALSVQEGWLNMATQNMADAKAKEAPLEQSYMNVINAGKSGDYSTLISAAGTPITNITQMNKQATESVMNNIPAGAGRDAALAQAKMGEGTDIATALNNLFQNALTGEANLGSQAAQIGLQEAGAGLNAGGQASASNQALMQANEQGKASTMGFLGSLAGAAGTAYAG